MEDLAGKWDASYKRKDNFLFFPNEEIIRFCSKFVAKRTGITEITPVFPNSSNRLLDLGCGIGRHIIFFSSMGMDAYEIDLSEEAVATAKKWAQNEKITNASEKIIQGDSSNQLPWENEFFNYVISHGVLDSMPFVQAKHTIEEVGRVLSPGGMIYCDLVSGADSQHAREYCGEEVVTTRHEENTIQSYFNYSKIKTLFPPDRFEIIECTLIKKENVNTGEIISRYHLTIRKKISQAIYSSATEN